jgi:hypothetical protein
VYLTSLHRRIVAGAEGALNGTLSITEAARELTGVSHELNMSRERQFVVFVGIASETDEFPLGAVRDMWNPAKLLQVVAQRGQYENRVRSTADAACKELLQRYASTV